MPWEEFGPTDRIATVAGPSVVVCIPLYGAHDMFKRCVSSIVRHTPSDVPLLIADDADPDPGAREWLRELAREHLEHTVLWLRQAENRGFPGNVNAAFAAASGADVALVNSDCEVADGWLAGLQDAAYVDGQVATATALTNHGSIVSVPYRNHPVAALPQGTSFDAVANRLRATSARLRPRLPTAVGHCFFVRRSALQLVGGFDESFAPGYGEEVDFSQRCLAMGLQHVLADDVLVLHHGGASLGVSGERNPIQDEHETILKARYPAYHPAVAEAESDSVGSLPRSLAIARRAILEPTVTIDGRCLTAALTGTQLNVLEFVQALSATGAVRIRVITPPDIGDYAKDALEAMPRVLQLPAGEITDGTPRDDVVHRPYQIASAGDMQLLRRVGERLTITHLDLIAYRNPSYFDSADTWAAFRRLTRSALNLADLVFFISSHAEQDAQVDALLPAERSRVVELGTDHRLSALHPSPARPGGAGDVQPGEYLLCLGTDFRHKNRLFAMRLLYALRVRHGWDGRLVLAGPNVAHGSSIADETAWELAHPAAAASILRVPAVSESEKRWLIRNAAAVVYPSTYEGFGFVPFEAAAEGVPCFFAHVSSLAETLAQATAVIVPWDADVTADRAIGALRDAERRSALVAEVSACASRYRWSRTAELTLAAYDEVVRSSTPPAAAAAADAIESERNMREMELRYWSLWNEIGPTGMSLVGPDGRLPDDVQHAVAALVSRSSTRGPFLAALRAARRATHRGSEGR
jgi:GT2 family glycosyltransferase/glycosyltransferase involved in cell wall biosynthesis